MDVADTMELAGESFLEELVGKPEWDTLTKVVETTKDGVRNEKIISFMFHIIPDNPNRTLFIQELIMLAGGDLIKDPGDDPHTIKIFNDLPFVVNRGKDMELPPDLYSSRFIYEAIMLKRRNLPLPDLRNYLITHSEYKAYDPMKILTRDLAWSSLEKVDDPASVPVRRAQQVALLDLEEFEKLSTGQTGADADVVDCNKQSKQIKAKDVGGEDEEHVEKEVEGAGEDDELVEKEDEGAGDERVEKEVEGAGEDDEHVEKEDEGAGEDDEHVEKEDEGAGEYDEHVEKEDEGAGDDEHVENEDEGAGEDEHVEKEDEGVSDSRGEFSNMEGREIVQRKQIPSPGKSVSVKSPSRGITLGVVAVAGPSNRIYKKRTEDGPNKDKDGWIDRPTEHSDIEDVSFDEDEDDNDERDHRPKRSKPERGLFYSKEEDQLIIDKICEAKAFEKTGGLTLFKFMAKSKEFKGIRTPFSLENRWRKTLKPKLLNNWKAFRAEFKISEEDSKQLLAGLQKTKLCPRSHDYRGLKLQLK